MGSRGSVKTPEGTTTVASRIRRLRSLANPLGQRPLRWPEFAQFAGVPLGTAKKWESRGQISHDLAVQLAKRLQEAGFACTAEWIRLGEGPPPRLLGAGQPGVKPSAPAVAESPAAGYDAERLVGEGVAKPAIDRARMSAAKALERFSDPQDAKVVVRALRDFAKIAAEFEDSHEEFMLRRLADELEDAIEQRLRSRPPSKTTRQEERGRGTSPPAAGGSGT